MHCRSRYSRQCRASAKTKAARRLIAAAATSLATVLTTVLTTVLAIVLSTALVAGCGASTPRTATPVVAPLPVRVSAAQQARLPMATTFGTSAAAPQDPDPFAPETGTVLHPTVTQVVYARPGGPPVAALPVTELGSPTWVPVVQSQLDWGRILLPTRPDRSTGWIYLKTKDLSTAYSAYRIEVSLPGYRLTVLDAGRTLGSWTVAVGAPGTPTPAGRTFLLASIAPLHPTYSPLILPLGTHSDTLSTFGGGPGTVGLHGWPDPAVFGHAISHGCVRVPAAALRVLSRVPLGSSVVITG
jgi:lipoprotein-anchoring transpeptidase ErfK/SrfK